MDGGNLNHRAARGNQPLEALPVGKPGYWSGTRITGAYLRECFEMLLNDFQIETWPKCPQPLDVDMYAGLQEAAFDALQNQAGIQELAALRARHDAYDGIV